MRKRISFLPVVAIICVIASCQKELSNEDGNPPGGNNPTLADTTKPADTTNSTTNTEVAIWKFISLHGTIAQVAQRSNLRY